MWVTLELRLLIYACCDSSLKYQSNPTGRLQSLLTAGSGGAVVLQCKLQLEEQRRAQAEQRYQQGEAQHHQLQQQFSDSLQHVRAVEERMEQAVLCQICFERPRDTVLMPCMHFLYCQSCMHQSSSSCSGAGQRCPVCRAAVSGQVVVHLASSL